MKSRNVCCEIGKSSSCMRVSADDRSPVAAWSIGDSAVTVTLSVVPPTWSTRASTTTRSPPLTLTPCRDSVRKPFIVTWTVYVSGVTFGMTYCPSALVTTGEVLVPCASLTMMTAAPGTTPPCASVTLPVTAPVVICADAGAAMPHAVHRASASIRFLKPSLIDPPGVRVVTSAAFHATTSKVTRGSNRFDSRPAWDE